VRTDLDDGNPGIIVEVRNDVIGHTVHLDTMQAQSYATSTVTMPREPYRRSELNSIVAPLICSYKFDTILALRKSPSFVGAVESWDRHTIILAM
jgi:hypothetical protein